MTPEGSQQARVARNDELIVQAAASVLGEEGWAHLGLNAVARRAGLSTSPVRDRYPDRIALARAAWERVVSPVWMESIAAVIDAADTADDLGAALAPFITPDPVHRAAGELLMVAAHDDQVRDVIRDRAIEPLAVALDPDVAGGSQRAATRAYAVTVALGLLLESWRAYATEVDLTTALDRVAAIIRSPGEPRPLPPERARHIDEGPRIDTGQEMWDAVLKATLRQVGTRGYEAATVESIVSEAGCSQTVLFRRYPTKADAFLDASRRMIGAATELNLEFQMRMAEQYSPGLAEAMMLREFMSPGRDVERILGLEQYRLAWHDEHLRTAVQAEQETAIHAFLDSLPDMPRDEALARVHMEFAVGMGPVLLAALVPQTWTLPFDVITVPLIDGRE